MSHQRKYSVKAPTQAPPSWNALRYDLYSLWLFTYSDLKTIVGPKTAFGLFSALRASVFGLPCEAQSLIWRRLPLVAIWTWINLLPFSIDNQRQAEAIQEDRVNKPWRPMPSRRLTSRQAKRWMIGFYPLAIIFSLYIGGFRQCLTLVLLGIWYNDLAGADRDPLVRNFINTLGFLCYTSGAMEVAYGARIPMISDSLLTRWLLIIGAVVFSTIHTQDMYDQLGDSRRGRCTMPLLIGDRLSRVTIAISMVFWSCLGPWFWQVDALGFAAPIALGLTVSIRTMTMRTVEDDKRTFHLWNLWIVMLYFLPVLKVPTSQTREGP